MSQQRPLEYRPDINYTIEDHEAVPILTNNINQEFTTEPDSLMDVWDQVCDTLDVVDNLISKLNGLLANVVTNVDTDAEVMRLLKDKYQDNLPDNQVSFSFYRQLLQDNGEEAQLVRDLFEYAHEGLSGNIAIELFPFATGLQRHAESLEAVLKDTLLNIYNENIDSTVPDRNNSELIRQANQAESLYRDRITELHRRREEIAREVATLDDHDEYNRITDQLRFELDADTISRDLKSIARTKTSLISIQAEQISRMLDLADEDYLGAPIEDILSTLGNQLGHQQYDLLFTTSCNKRATESRKNKERLRNIQAETLSPLAHMVTVMTHYRRKVLTPTADWIMQNGFRELSTVDPTTQGDNSALFSVADILAEAMEYANDDYLEAISGYDRLSHLNHELCQNSLDALYNKERTRVLNRLLNR